MNVIFNSRDTFYKHPFGAVQTQTPVQFVVTLPLDYSFSTVKLCVYDNESFHQEITMVYLHTYEDKIYYRCSFTPTAARAYFYYFCVHHESDDIIYIKRLDNGQGVLSKNGADFQLTVYNKGAKTPDCVKGGIMYQIFPDRFFFSGGQKDNVPDDRILHSDWGGQPFFMPNENGEVLNNDYFCGDLKGIEQKLPYLRSLGVTLLYLNPIFEAHSSHRYNTANYMRIDPLLGTEEDFVHLCKTAKQHGIRIILDGVFNHTGDDSIYFNRKKRYDVKGAFNAKDSPYYSWYNFSNYPNKYNSWWGFVTLPVINKSDPNYVEYICGKNGVLRKWLRLGACGFRLDVADELSDEFIEKIRKTVKEEDPENLLIGEVWEDASNKVAYGVHRKYFMGNELDSVMNYPFKDAILSFVRHKNKNDFINRIMTIVENYPPEALHTAMNSLSTHDVERAITVLAGEPCEGRDRYWQANHVLNLKQYQLGVQLLKAAMVLQFFLPGIPCIYYGDEAGLQGYKDPFNRKCFPWGCENNELLQHTKLLASIRSGIPAMKKGSLAFFDVDAPIIVFHRKDDDGQTIVALNYTDSACCVSLAFDCFTCRYGNYNDNLKQLSLGAYQFAVFYKT